jgi:hypothetical protein
MGIDIYGCFMKKERGQWIPVEEYEYWSRGKFRSWLAPFRSGIEAISPFRGFHPDFDPEKRGNMSLLVYDSPRGMNSWLTADEILAALPAIWTTTVRLSYEKFLAEDFLEEFNKVEPYEDSHNWKFIAADWRSFEEGYTIDSWGVDLFFDISEDEDFKTFIDKVRELKTTHGEVCYWFTYT